LLRNSIYQDFYFFIEGYLFNLLFVARNNAVQYRSNVKWCH